MGWIWEKVKEVLGEATDSRDDERNSSDNCCACKHGHHFDKCGCHCHGGNCGGYGTYDD